MCLSQQRFLCAVSVLDAQCLASGPPYQVADSRHEDEVIVHAGADEQNDVANRLEEFKVLPANNEREGPDEDGTDTIQHHPRGGAHLLGDGKAGEVEEGDADNQAQVGKEKSPVVPHLD